MSNDKLFSFLRSKLFGPDVNKEGWPVPPDHVFDNAMIEWGAIQTNRKRQRRRKVLAVLAAAIIAGLITSLGLYLNSLNDKIESLEVLVTEFDEHPDTGEKAIRQVTKGRDSEGSFKDGLNEKETLRTESSTAVLNNTDRNGPAMIQNVNRLNSDHNGGKQKLTDHGDISGEIPHRVIHNIEKDGRAIIELPPLATVGYRHVVPGELSRHNTVEALHSRHDRKGNWYIRVAGIANASSLSMSNIPSSAPLLTGYDDFYWGGGIELSLEYMVSQRWSITGGVSYSRATNRSNLVDRHMYDESNEGMDANGEPMYGAEVLLESPFGPHPCTIDFYTDGYNFESGMLLDEMVEHRQSMDMWGLSAGVNYLALAGQKFELTLGAGLGATFLSGLNSNLRAEVYYEGSFITKVVDDSDDRRMLNRVSLNAHATVLGRYFVHEQIGITAGLGYTRSITSLRDASNGQPKTFMTQIVPSLGIVFKLNNS